MSFKLLCRWAFFVCFTAVTVLALLPAEDAVITTGWDKANHCLAFTVLLGLLDNGYPRLAFAKKFGFLLLYGLMIEVIQAMLPTRMFSGWDILADATGLLLYLIVRPFIIQNFPFICRKDFQP